MADGRPPQPAQRSATLKAGGNYGSQMADMGADLPPPVPRRSSSGVGFLRPSAASKEAACREQLAMVRDTLASMRPGSGAQSEGVERERLHFTIAQLVQDLEYLVAARDPAVDNNK